ncbi:MAG: ATP cone domain-containing protein [Patescibacteria group bacterium]
MNRLITIVKSDGTREIFAEEKLRHSLTRVGATPEVIEEIVETIVSEIRDGMTTHEIYSRAFSLLKKDSSPIAIKYSIRRALFELGPDGFPFEKFVARIFRMWGYETLTDQMVMGQCVPHEMDVVAWKGDTLAMIEAKFHNAFGLKSDLKVALYIKARFDDLSGILYDYGAKERKLEERWLITNTKFSEQAIHYGVCQKIQLVGWNYPDHNNLHQIIEQNGLHPITAITSLSAESKRELIGQDILVCIDLVDQQDVLTKIGIKGVEAEKIIAEARTIIEKAK